MLQPTLKDGSQVWLAVMGVVCTQDIEQSAPNFFVIASSSPRRPYAVEVLTVHARVRDLTRYVLTANCDDIDLYARHSYTPRCDHALIYSSE